MALCEWCGKSFDPEFDADTFDIQEGMLTYRNVRKCLCASCAIQAIDDQVEDVYFETCERCGKEFDYIVDAGEFSSEVNGVDLVGTWRKGPLCCDCALDEVSRWRTMR